MKVNTTKGKRPFKKKKKKDFHRNKTRKRLTEKNFKMLLKITENEYFGRISFRFSFILKDTDDQLWNRSLLKFM